MSIIRVAYTKKYASNFDDIFRKKKRQAKVDLAAKKDETDVLLVRPGHAAADVLEKIEGRA